MRRASVLVLVAGVGLLCGQPGEAGPVLENLGFKVPVQPEAAVTLDKGKRSLGERAKFKGGQRACVIVAGSHKPVVPLVLEIRDDKGTLVARDEPGKGVSADDAPGNDLCAVIWYPPRDGYYSITIKNPGEKVNPCWVAIK